MHSESHSTQNTGYPFDEPTFVVKREVALKKECLCNDITIYYISITQNFDRISLYALSNVEPLEKIILC